MQSSQSCQIVLLLTAGAPSAVALAMLTRVVVSSSWSCCLFAGRGFSHICNPSFLSLLHLNPLPTLSRGTVLSLIGIASIRIPFSGRKMFFTRVIRIWKKHSLIHQKVIIISMFLGNFLQKYCKSQKQDSTRLIEDSWSCEFFKETY